MGQPDSTDATHYELAQHNASSDQENERVEPKVSFRLILHVLVRTATMFYPCKTSDFYALERPSHGPFPRLNSI